VTGVQTCALPILRRKCAAVNCPFAGTFADVDLMITEDPGEPEGTAKRVAVGTARVTRRFTRQQCDQIRP